MQDISTPPELDTAHPSWLAAMNWCAWELMLNDLDARGRVRARDTILAGPRGIGKTATVFAYGDLCRARGYELVNLQAAGQNASLIDSLVRHADRRAAAGAGPWTRVKRAFERIASINVNVAGFGGGISTHSREQPRSAVAPEDLAEALAQLAREVRDEHPHGGVLVTVDEMQSAAHPELALLAAAIQRLNGDHADARVLFAGTALPHTTDVLSEAGETHADRLLYIRQLPLTLAHQDADRDAAAPRPRLPRRLAAGPAVAAAQRTAADAAQFRAQLADASTGWRSPSSEPDAMARINAQLRARREGGRP